MGVAKSLQRRGQSLDDIGERLHNPQLSGANRPEHRGHPWIRDMAFNAGSPDVFLSYARVEADFACELRARLKREVPDVRLWQDITDEEGGINWWRQITEALDTVENMILVLSPASAQSPTVQKEWRYARQQGVRIHPVRGAAFDQLALDALPRWIGKTHIYDLEYEWKKFVNYLRSPGRAARVPFMAPDPPEHLVARPDELGRLLTLVLGADHRDPSAVRAALCGAGGFGKTVLAIAVCHDDAVLTAFDDGILWVTLGEKPRLLDALTKLYRALTDVDPTFRDVEEASGQLAACLKDKTCLIVLDDVWDPAHLRPSPAAGPAPT